MRKIYSFLIIGCSILFLLSGCQSPSPQTPNIEMDSLRRSWSIMRAALKEAPQHVSPSRPYFESMNNIICSAAAQQRADTTKVMHDIGGIPATKEQTKVVNNLLSVWLSQTNNPDRQLILRGVCTGANIALYSFTGQSLDK